MSSSPYGVNWVLCLFQSINVLICLRTECGYGCCSDFLDYFSHLNTDHWTQERKIVRCLFRSRKDHGCLCPAILFELYLQGWKELKSSEWVHLCWSWIDGKCFFPFRTCLSNPRMCWSKDSLNYPLELTVFHYHWYSSNRADHSGKL